jgi:phospholipase C
MVKITQIIVLMMENRSFDHLLSGFPGLSNPLPKGMTVPIDTADPSKGTAPITYDAPDISLADPPHHFKSVTNQWMGGEMNGFYTEAELMEPGGGPTAIQMVDPEKQTTILRELAAEYALFEGWFPSIPSCTDPNRQFAMSGTSRGSVTNYNGTLYNQQSHLDFIRQEGLVKGSAAENVTSGGYYQDDLWNLGAFEDYFIPENAGNIKDLDSHFYEDLATGVLPTYSWLQPRMGVHTNPTRLPNWQHPDASIELGELLIMDVYNAVRASPKWNETLFIITYDEHGGFYDHVPPPVKNVPSPDGLVSPEPDNFAFDRLGVRIPTIAISPWIAKNTIIPAAKDGESQWEATSVIKTANELMGIETNGRLGERVEWSLSFADMIEKGTLRDDCLMKAGLHDGDDFDSRVRLQGSDLESAFNAQRLKPLNEHLEFQLLLICRMNYPEDFRPNEFCPQVRHAMKNQGSVSDFMKVEQLKFKKI